MSGVRESERKNLSKPKRKKIPVTFESVEKKYKKENMSAEEFAMLLCLKRELKPGSITDKTVKNYMTEICKMSDGLLSIGEFKKNPDKEKSKYEFKPEHHDMLLTLMASDYFDGRKNDRRLGTRAVLYDQLTKNIEEYLQESDKKIIKANPTYYNACLENELTKRLINELSSLLRNLYHSEPVMRYQFMIEILNKFHFLNQWVMREDSKAMSTRMVYAHNLDELKDSIYQKGVFEATEFGEFIVKYFALKAHGENYNYVSDNEELSCPAYILATKLFNITVKDDTDIKKKIDEVDQQIENNIRYKELMEKAKQILDIDNAAEFNMYIDIKRLAAVQYLRPFVSKDDYEQTIRFTEECIKQDKWDILNALLQLDRSSMTDEQIRKIMDIKDHK